jgi:hypothetical protein
MPGTLGRALARSESGGAKGGLKFAYSKGIEVKALQATLCLA